MYPRLGKTSPTYLKASLTLAHVVSVYLVLMMPVTTNPSKNQHSSQNIPLQHDTDALKESERQVADWTHAMYTDTSKIVTALSDTAMETMMYLPQIAFEWVGIGGPREVPTQEPFLQEELPRTTFQKSSQKDDHFEKGNIHSQHTNAFLQNVSHGEWVHWWKTNMHAHTIMHHCTGQHGFIYAPVFVCMLCMLAACVPSLATFTKYREHVIAVVLPCMTYMSFCSALCATFVVSSYEHGMEKYYPPYFTASVFLLHVIVHALHHTLHTYRKIAAGMRQIASCQFVFVPMIFVAFGFVFFFALGMPTVLYHIPTNMQDVIVMHVFSWVLPECLGFLVSSIVSLVQKIFDNTPYDLYI